VPPRHLKSLTVSVAFPAFLLGLEAEASHLRHQLRYRTPANGSRARLSRDIANITMDLDNVETIDVNAKGGADTITVDDLDRNARQ
jgi:hypothetical protein